MLSNDEILRIIYNNHSYSITQTERVDMTSYETYSIDPIGCKDADDAFSIYTENQQIIFCNPYCRPNRIYRFKFKFME